MYYQQNITNCYQSENQVGNYNYANSPIDYLQDILCPVFCVYKSISYVHKRLNINVLQEYARPPDYDVI